MLYLMHVDWGWIKQRPHFLAEELSKTFDLLVIYPFSYRYRAQGLLVRNASAVRRLPFFSLLPQCLPWVRRANRFLLKQCLRAAVRWHRPNVVWISSPMFGAMIADVVPEKTALVYDCMDDALEFKVGVWDEEILAASERVLIRKASVVFASSRILAERLIARGCDAKKLCVIRNGFGGEVLRRDEPPGSRPKGGPFKIGYAGTISHWIDFEAMLHCLERMPDLEFHLIGPVTAPCASHARLFLHTAISHERLPEAAASFDCMIVPFKRNALIEAVDPVKIYDYVNFRKNILSVRYPEIERHAPFVHFYRTEEEMLDLIAALRRDNRLKYSEKERVDFLSKSSWEQRTVRITEILGLKLLRTADRSVGARK